MKVKAAAIKRRFITCAAALLLLPTSLAWGQPQQDAPEGRPETGRYRFHGPEGVDPRELLEQVMIARLSKELALDNEQTVVLVRHITENRERIRELRQRRSELMRELKQVLEEGGSEEEIESKLEALLQHEDETLNARREFFQVASADLSTWQRARLYVFLNEFDSQMRGIIDRARRHRDDDGEHGRSGPPFRGPRRSGDRDGDGDRDHPHDDRDYSRDAPRPSESQERPSN